MNLSFQYTISPHHKRLAEFVLLVCLVFLGLVIRFDDIYKWQGQPQKIFSGSEPMLTTSDGYFYLRLARDIAEDRYDPVDSMRTVPELKPRPSPPPLISILTSFIHKNTSISMNWIAVSLPAFLSVLLAVPLYALGKHFGGTAMALTAVAFALSSNAYFFKTTLGKFDTDCLNVVFTMTTALCFLKFAKKEGLGRYVYCVLGLLAYLLFFLWWDQVPAIVTGISLFPLLIALLIFYRPGKREGIVFISLLLAVVVSVLFVMGPGDVVNIFLSTLKSLYSYLSKEELPWFPQIGQVINEQARLPLKEVVANSSNNIAVFILGLVGIFGVFIIRFKEALFLLVPLALACLSLLFAMRFMIFLAPVLALGVGYFVAKAWEMSKGKIYICVVPLLVVYMIFQNVVSTEMTYPYSVFSSESVAGLKKASALTPQDSLLWSTCDNGYLINYYADRPTMCDGQFHRGEKSVYNAIPLVTDDFRFSANFINFFAVRGEKGIRTVNEALDGDRDEALKLIREILAAGSEKAGGIISKSPLAQYSGLEGTSSWVDFFYPSSQKSVYLFIDWSMILRSPGLYWNGTWDIKKHDGVTPLPVVYFFNAMKVDAQIVDTSKSMRADFEEGNVYFSDNVVPLASARKETAKTSEVYKYSSGIVEVKSDGLDKNDENVAGDTITIRGQYHFEFIEKNNFAILIDQKVSASIYYQLFFSRESPSPKYFQPVSLNAPHYQIWKVVGG